MRTEGLLLVATDEPPMQRIIRYATEERFEVLSSSSLEDVLRQVEHVRPDAVVVDGTLADGTGLEAVRRLREWSDVPLIFIGADRAGDIPELLALDSGADDYVARPFNPDIFVARLRALLRRVRMARVADGRAEPVLDVGDVTIDLRRRWIERDGHRLELTRMEWLVLYELARNPDTVLFARELLVRVWGHSYADQPEILRVVVSRLRRKIERDALRPEIILTAHGLGYVFVTRGEAIGAGGRAEVTAPHVATSPNGAPAGKTIPLRRPA